MRPTTEHDGVTYTYKDEHGAWFADPEHEAAGTLHAPAYTDGSMATDDIGEIDITYYEGNGGPCSARCRLCMEEEARQG